MTYNGAIITLNVKLYICKAYRESGGMVAFTLNLRTGQRQVVSPTPQPLYLWEKRPLVPIE